MKSQTGMRDEGSELMLSRWTHRKELVQGGKKGTASYTGAQCQSKHENNLRREGKRVETSIESRIQSKRPS